MIEDNINPIYYETIEMLYDMADIDTSPPIVFNIWDRDANMLDSDDYLGRAVVYLKDSASNLNVSLEEVVEQHGQESIDNEEDLEELKMNTIPKPKWHDIRLNFDDKTPATG